MYMYIDLLAKEEADKGQFVIMLKWRSGAVVLYHTADLRVPVLLLVDLNTSAARHGSHQQQSKQPDTRKESEAEKRSRVSACKGHGAPKVARYFGTE